MESSLFCILLSIYVIFIRTFKFYAYVRSQNQINFNPNMYRNLDFVNTWVKAGV